jgi:hypothetical protein
VARRQAHPSASVRASIPNPCVNMLSQISAILGGLESHILRRKRKIYKSVTSSIQNDLKPCYEGGSQGGASSSWVSGTLPFSISLLLCWLLYKNPPLQSTSGGILNLHVETTAGRRERNRGTSLSTCCLGSSVGQSFCLCLL